MVFGVRAYHTPTPYSIPQNTYDLSRVTQPVYQNNHQINEYNSAKAFDYVPLS